MFGLDIKSLAIGIALGWFVIPRLQMLIMSKVNG